MRPLAARAALPRACRLWRPYPAARRQQAPSPRATTRPSPGPSPAVVAHCSMLSEHLRKPDYKSDTRQSVYVDYTFYNLHFCHEVASRGQTSPPSLRHTAQPIPRAARIGVTLGRAGGRLSSGPPALREGEGGVCVLGGGATAALDRVQGARVTRAGAARLAGAVRAEKSACRRGALRGCVPTRNAQSRTTEPSHACPPRAPRGPRAASTPPQRARARMPPTPGRARASHALLAHSFAHHARSLCAPAVQWVALEESYDVLKKGMLQVSCRSSPAAAASSPAAVAPAPHFPPALTRVRWLMRAVLHRE